MVKGMCVAAVAIVGLGLLLRLSGTSSSPDPARASEPAPASPPATVRKDVDQLNERLLRDDTLAPPGARASRQEQEAYAATLDRIHQGEDPLQATLDPQSEAARERIHKRLEAAKLRRAELKKSREERQARMHDKIKEMQKRRDEKFGPRVPQPDTDPHLTQPVQLAPAISPEEQERIRAAGKDSSKHP